MVTSLITLLLLFAAPPHVETCTSDTDVRPASSVTPPSNTAEGGGSIEVSCDIVEITNGIDMPIVVELVAGGVGGRSFTHFVPPGQTLVSDGVSLVNFHPLPPSEDCLFATETSPCRYRITSWHWVR